MLMLEYRQELLKLGYFTAIEAVDDVYRVNVSRMDESGGKRLKWADMYVEEFSEEKIMRAIDLCVREIESGE